VLGCEPWHLYVCTAPPSAHQSTCEYLFLAEHSASQWMLFWNNVFVNGSTFSWGHDDAVFLRAQACRSACGIPVNVRHSTRGGQLSGDTSRKNLATALSIRTFHESMRQSVGDTVRCVTEGVN
jgi:hypothetical protein